MVVSGVGMGGVLGGIVDVEGFLVGREWGYSGERVGRWSWGWVGERWCWVSGCGVVGVGIVGVGIVGVGIVGVGNVGVGIVGVG